jgi:hypothetical protein
VASRVLGVFIDRAELLVGSADPRPGHLVRHELRCNDSRSSLSLSFFRAKKLRVCMRQLALSLCGRLE